MNYCDKNSVFRPLWWNGRHDRFKICCPLGVPVRVRLEVPFFDFVNKQKFMIAHIGIYVDDLKKSDAFYRSLFQVIGYEVVLTIPQCIAYGFNNEPLFEIYTGKPKSSSIHVAFHVKSKQIVESFYTRALSLGGQDNGKPGYRDYFPNYYAAFITDLNGNNLEALFVGN